MKFGRRKPVAIGPHLRLRNYLRASLPTAPATSDYSAAASGVLADVMMNDQLGDCVVAGGYHIVGVETGNAGTAFHATQSQVVADYSAIGGYVPGDESTDNGCNLQDALNYWTSHGFANGTKLLGWLAVDGTNVAEIQAAMWLFENLYFGMELPDAWISPFPSGSGFTWDVAGAADPQNGHCVMGVGHNTTGVQIGTWGLIGTLTYSAIAEYATSQTGGELYVMLTPDQLAKGAAKAPNGVAWGDIIADFDSLGGHVPAPSPTPSPQPPAPTPSGPVTAAQVQAAIAAAFAHAYPFMTRTHALSIASAAVAALPWSS